jgi:hypothetical protein
LEFLPAWIFPTGLAMRLKNPDLGLPKIGWSCNNFAATVDLLLD